jgi:hypothetical protein
MLFRFHHFLFYSCDRLLIAIDGAMSPFSVEHVFALLSLSSNDLLATLKKNEIRLVLLLLFSLFSFVPEEFFLEKSGLRWNIAFSSRFAHTINRFLFNRLHSFDRSGYCRKSQINTQ